MFRTITWLIDTIFFYPLEKIICRLAGHSLLKNPYYSRNFAPVNREISAIDLKVEGEIPEDLEGEFVRNGPNSKFTPRTHYHWFDGDGMLHGVRLSKGKVNYFNRWIKTLKLEEEEKRGRAIFIKIGDMCGKMGLFNLFLNSIKRLIGYVPNLNRLESGTANTAVEYHNGQLMALVENSLPYIVQVLQDGQFETIGMNSYGGRLKHPFTAHPKVDAETGEMLFFGYQVDRKPYCTFSAIDKNGNLVKTIEINEIEDPIMMHDFAITQNFCIFMDLPLIFKKQRIVKGIPFYFDSNKNGRFGIMPRNANSSNEIRWFNVGACFIFHVVNAWEEYDKNGKLDHIVLFACRSLKIELGELSLSESTKPFLYEWKFNMKDGSVSERRVLDICCEFPRIDNSLIGRKNQFAYIGTMQPRNESIYFDGIVKVDLLTSKQIARIVYGDNKFAGEPVFVSRQNAKSEDDGYLLTFVHNENNQITQFSIFDSKTMSPYPIAQVTLPQRVPYGFHGIFISEQQIQQQQQTQQQIQQ
eukprot:TRINITY_DN953_c0_g7_i1.p1 TRINITY_DN953_c0_g7~~TRINITY_DN953_c0_g7_i1.p1  ORF type:complete len:526 (-),score=231.30 TRINITY_DN953_c0_g7_i1:40-1617(-)